MNAIACRRIGACVARTVLCFTSWDGGMLPYLTAEQCEAVAVGRLRVVGRRRTILAKLGPQQLARYRRAESEHVVRERGSRWSRAAELYFLRCEALEQPFVRVAPRRRYASVDLDLITCRWRRLSIDAETRIAALLQHETPPGGRVYVGVWTGSDRVPLDRAEMVAARLWAIATAPGGLVDEHVGDPTEGA